MFALHDLPTAKLPTRQRVHLVCACLCRALAVRGCWQAGEHPSRPLAARLPDHVRPERGSTRPAARPADLPPPTAACLPEQIVPNRHACAMLPSSCLQHGA
jgi:hypothetical protein